jgi:hypothetical protein
MTLIIYDDKFDHIHTIFTLHPQSDEWIKFYINLGYVVIGEL